MQIKQQLMSTDKYSKKAPYSMSPEFIIIHNTANDASAKNEIAYMVKNDNSTSYHIAVDDVEAIQAIPFNRNSWNAGDGSNGRGNRKGIAIEICYSKSGGPKFDKAEINAAKVTAQILKQYNWSIDRVMRHKDFSGKNCPHRTMANGWQRFLNMVQVELGGATVSNLLRYGSKGNDVKKLQSDLISIGYPVGKWGADGHFGDGTKDAVIRFQKYYKLAQDGIAGPDTLNKLRQVIDAKNKPPTVIPKPPVDNKGKTPIVGKSIATAKQMEIFLLNRNKVPKLSVDPLTLAKLFLEEGEIEGIRGDIAFCQSLKETGSFKYGNLVLPEQNNYAGIGATNNSKVGKGAWFKDAREGVRAQIQHLKAYANKDSISKAIVDPRFDLVQPRGKAPNWEDLNGYWAVPGNGYGESILSIYNELTKVEVEVEDAELEKVKAHLRIAEDKLNKIKDILK